MCDPETTSHQFDCARQLTFLITLACLASAGTPLRAQSPDSISRAHRRTLRALQSASVLQCKFDTSYVSLFDGAAWSTAISQNRPESGFLISEIDLRRGTARRTFLGENRLTGVMHVRAHPDGIELTDSLNGGDVFGNPLGSRTAMIVFAWKTIDPHDGGLPLISSETSWSSSAGAIAVMRVGKCTLTTNSR